MKRFFVIMMAVVIAAIPAMNLSAAGGTESSGKAPVGQGTMAVAKTGLPIVQQKLSLEGVAAKNFAVADWNGLLTLQEYEKRTNIHVNWTMIPEETFIEKRNILIASDDLPDFFIRAYFSSIDEAMYGSQGILVPLNPLIDNYAPYLKDIMSKNPIVRKAIAQPDGNIYTLPQLNECMGSLVDKNWIRDPWIEKLGIKKPANLDGLYDTLVKFKNTDFNGNGKADEIPMSGAYRGFTGKYISKYFAGSFGFGRIGGLYEQFIDINANNQAEFIPLNENYKSMLQYINKLYSAGLIDQELFTLNNPRFMAKCEEGNIGAVLGGNNFSFFGGGHMWEYSSIVPLGGKTGSAYWIRVFPLVQTTGTAAITHKNKYPEATMRYLDYLYSDEGTRLARLGVEGVTYSKNPTGPNGKYKYFDFITNDPSGNTQDQMVGKYAIYPGGNIPQLITNDNNLGLAVWPQIVAATEVYLPYLPKEILCLNFAAGEISELNGLRNDILTYIEEMEIKFITGAENFSNWNTFKKDLEQMNVKRYVEIYSAAYKRWNSL